MICRVHPTFRLDDFEVAWILSRLSKQGSVFQGKLEYPRDIDGYIATVHDQGEMVGWARTEHWRDTRGTDWETLEAFVAPEYRCRGLARFAASGLAAAGAIKSPSVAVFSPPMISIAESAGMIPVLYALDGAGRWIPKT